MKKKRILLTGATGLVGASLIRTLHSEFEIHALVRSNPESRNKNVTYYEVDFANGSMPANLPSQMDIIVHLAQSNLMRDFPARALDIYNVNVHSTALLLDYAQNTGVSHFVFASTGGLYEATAGLCLEDTHIKLQQGPLAYYFTTKYISENLVRAYAEQMTIQILRPFFIYGPGQKNEMFLPRLIQNIKHGNPITLQGENGVLVNPVYVNDVVELIRACLTINNSLTVNVSGPDIISIRQISEIIGDKIGTQPLFSLIDEVPHNIIGSNERMLDILNRPLTQFHNGIQEMLL